MREGVRQEVEHWVAAGNPAPGLATILVGDDPASEVYVRNKRKACEAAGMRSIHHELAADTSQDEVAALIEKLNADAEVTGILLQLPVPPQIDGDEMTGLIDPLKDVDGLTPINAGLLSQGREALVACTPSGVMELLREADVELKGAEAVVVGRSKLVGKPVVQLLLAEDATVTTAHSRTRDLAEVCRRADVLVAAVGVPRLVNADMVKPGRRRDRRGHQPRRGGPRRRRRLRGRQGEGRRDHTGARRRGADDDRDAAREHDEGCAASGVRGYAESDGFRRDSGSATG